MKFITVYKGSVNQKTPAENILGFKVYFNAVLFRAERLSVSLFRPNTERCSDSGTVEWGGIECQQ